MPGRRLGLQTSHHAAMTRPPSVPVYSADRWVYPTGSPTYNTTGWNGGDTEFHWERQGPVSATRVYYDDSVQLMQSADSRCHTLACAILTGDAPDASGQRAQIVYPSFSGSGGYPGFPDPKPWPGETWWYGFAVKTNAGYVPNVGTFNMVQGTHFSGPYQTTASSPYFIAISTKGPVGGGDGPVFANDALVDLVGSPRFILGIYGGEYTDPGWNTGPTENGNITARWYLGPTFTAGTLYKMQLRIVWSNTKPTGAYQWWVNGTKYLDVTGLATTMHKSGVPDPDVHWEHNNYCFDNPTAPDKIVYHGGLIRGSTQFDVTVP